MTGISSYDEVNFFPTADVLILTFFLNVMILPKDITFPTGRRPHPTFNPFLSTFPVILQSVPAGSGFKFHLITTD